MKTRNRFLKSVIRTAQDTKTSLPFERGARRTAFIASRKAPQLRIKTA